MDAEDIILRIMMLFVIIFAVVTFVSMNMMLNDMNDQTEQLIEQLEIKQQLLFEECEYLSQGTEEEQENVWKATSWYNAEYGTRIIYNTSEEVYEAYYDYLSYRNLTEEEFPIYDFRGDER